MTNYVRVNPHGSQLTVYHTDEDCPHFPDNYREVDAEYIEWHELSECAYCNGDHPGGAVKSQGHLESLKQAAQE